MRFAVSAMLLLLIVPSLLTSSAFAAPGDLDMSFGSSGIASGGGGVAMNLQLQSGGKIVVGGTLENAANMPVGFAVTRYTDAGALDTTFGTNGTVTTSFEVGGTPLYSIGFHLLRQPDDKLLMVGRAYSTGTTSPAVSYFALARYNADGSLDTTFGTGGTVLDLLDGRGGQALGGLVEPDGRIIVVGNAFPASTEQGMYAVVRYNANGSRDTSFGSGGLVLTGFGAVQGAGAADAYTAGVEPNGTIVVGGRDQNCPENQSCQPEVFTLARYTGNGALDTAFGSGGRAEAAIGVNADEPWGLAVQPDGKVLMGGRVNNGLRQVWGLARFSSDGTLDATFGSGGTVETPIGSAVNEAIGGVVLQPDGKIIAAGGAGTGTGSWGWGLARYLPDGSLDTTFGSGGEALPGGNVVAYGAVLDCSNRLLVSGGDGMTVGRFLTGLDTTPSPTGEGCPQNSEGSGAGGSAGSSGESGGGDSSNGGSSGHNQTDFVAIGDSVTAGFGYDPSGSEISLVDNRSCITNPGQVSCQSPYDVAYPAVYAKRHRLPTWDNLAVSGSTPADWLGEGTNDRSPLLQQAINENPRLVALTLGANPLLDEFMTFVGHPVKWACAHTLDVWSCVQRALDSSDVTDRLSRIYTKLLSDTSANVAVVLYYDTVPLLLSGANMRVLLTSLNADIASAATIVLRYHPDYRGRLRLVAPGPFQNHHCTSPEPWILLSDSCIHPNALGQQKIADAVDGVVERLTDGSVPNRPRVAQNAIVSSRNIVQINVTVSNPGTIVVQLFTPDAKTAVSRSAGRTSVGGQIVTVRKTGRVQIRVKLSPTARKRIALGRRHRSQRLQASITMIGDSGTVTQEQSSVCLSRVTRSNVSLPALGGSRRRHNK